MDKYALAVSSLDEIQVLEGAFPVCREPDLGLLGVQRKMDAPP